MFSSATVNQTYSTVYSKSQQGCEDMWGLSSNDNNNIIKTIKLVDSLNVELDDLSIESQSPLVICVWDSHPKNDPICDLFMQGIMKKDAGATHHVSIYI